MTTQVQFSPPGLSETSDLPATILHMNQRFREVAQAIPRTTVADIATLSTAITRLNATVGYTATALNNTVIGYLALPSSATGINLTALGYQALTANTTGFANSGLGSQSLASNTTGFQNFAGGWRALFANTVGNGNTALGNESLTALIDGYTNTAIGITSMVRAISCYNCTALGVDTLQFITTSASHSFTAIGSNALGFGDGGHSSTAVGWRSNTQGGGGIANTSIGLSSLNANLTGTLNFSGGTQSLYSNLGSYNTACGTNVFLNNVSGDRLVGLGFCAGVYELGSDALYIDNQDRGSTAGDKAGAILYGIFNATPASQRLRINATLGIGGAATSTSPLNITGLPTSAAGLASGDVWNSAGTLKVA